MGKKRPKMKSTGESTSSMNRQESGNSEKDQMPKRKRGRPRKVVMVEERDHQDVERYEDGGGKKDLNGGEQQMGMESMASDAVGVIGTGDDRKDAKFEGDDHKPKSRGRRKGKPQKST